MKKVAVFALILMLTIALTACGGSGGSSGQSEEARSAEETADAEASETEEQEAEPEETPVKEEAAWEVGEAGVKVWTDSIGTQWIQIIVPVTNTGTKDLFVSDCKIDVEDSSEHLLDSIDYVEGYPQIIQSGETAWYYEETTFDGDASGGVNVLPHVSVKESKTKCIRLGVSDLDIKDSGYGDLTVTGRVENTTDEEQSSVYIVAFMYDSEGKLIAQAYDIMMDPIAAGDKMGFSMSTFSVPDDVTLDSVANYEVIAFPYQFQF